MQFRLTSDHHMKDASGLDQVVPAGTVVGEGTNFPLYSGPSTAMEPLDEKAQKALEKRFGEEGKPKDPIEALPLKIAPQVQAIQPVPAAPLHPKVTPVMTPAGDKK